MTKLKMHTPDLVAENIEKIAALFPGCVTEAKDEKTGKLTRKIDFDQLRQELSNHIVEGPRERYHLDWPGKREALLAANAPIAKTLRPYREESVEFDVTKNLFIEGDNLDAIKLLQETYLGRIKLIYLDPPYNDGSDLLYNDDFAQNTSDYMQRSLQVEESGQRLVANTESNGRFHSDWLSMLYPRLRLARNLLQEDGAILISIDDVEVRNLRSMCDEIFGESNFVGSFVWEGGRKNDARLISASHDYILVYARDRLVLKEKEVKWREKKEGLDEVYIKVQELRESLSGDFNAIHRALLEWYSGLADGHPSKEHDHFSYVDDRGIYFPDNLRSPNPRPNLVFDWKGYKPHPNGWAYGREKMAELDADNRLYFPTSKEQRIKIKSYLHEHENWAPGSVFYKDRRAASKSLTKLMGGEVFDFPKDVGAISRLFGAMTSGDDIILDFFAGSGTTAEAVTSANAKDGARRRTILVQIAEPCAEESAAFVAGYRTIAEVTKERWRRSGAIARNQSGSQGNDYGFRVLRVDSSGFNSLAIEPTELKQVNMLSHVDNIRDDRTAEDLLFQVLVDWGVDLSLPIVIRGIMGKTVFFIDGNALVACFDAGLNEAFVKELAVYRPLRVVFRDDSYATDGAKINVEQIFKLLSPETEVRTL